MAETKLRVLYWNIYGGYTLEDKSWGKRVAGQAKLIADADPDVVILLEFHEDHDAYKALTRLLPDKYAISLGVGGNQCIYDSTRFKTIAKSSRDIKAGMRQVSKWNLLETETGKKFWIVGAHAPAGDTSARQRARAAYFAGVLLFTAGIARGIMGIDRNSSTKSTSNKAYGRSVLNLAGWKELGLKSQKASPANGMASHHGHNGDGLEKGEPIESIHTARLVDVYDWTMIPTHDLSDHHAVVANLGVR